MEERQVYINGSVFELSDSDRNVLNEYSDGLADSFEEILKELEFRYETADGKFVLKSKQLDELTLSDKTKRDLADFASKTFKLANSNALFNLFKEFIDHQLRVIQYYRIFNKFELLKKLPNEERKGLEDYSLRLEEQLKVHDLDKFTKDNIIQHYISQEFLGKIEKIGISDDLKKVLGKIRAGLRRVHGDTNKHHNEYYNYHQDEKANINKYIILEHVFDVLAIGDKRSEIPGEFYSRKKDTILFKNFSDRFNGLITNIYDEFKDQIFAETTKLKIEVEKLKCEKIENNKRIAELEKKIAEKTEDIVWQELDNNSDEKHLDKNIKYIKEISKDLYFAIENDWANGDRSLRHFTIISDYKKKVFDTQIDLLEQLKLAVEEHAEKEAKLIKTSALLETLNTLEQKNDEQIANSFEKRFGSKNILEEYIKGNEEQLRTKREYIRKRNESVDGENFYVGRVLK